jgi:hypothetical protein
MPDQPFELWETSRFLGVFRAVEADPLYWMNWFQNEIRSDDEYIDFEKMPIEGRKLAPFVLPLGKGASIFDDKATHFRFKPAYVKLEDRVDPLMPLTRRVGIDADATQPVKLSPMERLDLIKAAMTATHVRGIRRTWNYMAAVALRDGQITLSGKDYPTTLVDFRRDASHTITLGAGDRLGDSGVSSVDFFQMVLDTMTSSEFGAVPTRATMGGGVWAVLRKDEEFMKHMDTNLSGGNIRIERGLVPGAGEKVFKVGEMTIGGSSGQVIELWVDNSTFQHPETGVESRYIGSHQIVFTGSPEAVNGYRAFGRIIDRAADYEPLPIFPKNWVQQGDVDVEHISHKSAPLMVPFNANSTALANAVAPA